MAMKPANAKRTLSAAALAQRAGGVPVTTCLRAGDVVTEKLGAAHLAGVKYED
jgi:hypothetical protein